MTEVTKSYRRRQLERAVVAAYQRKLSAYDQETLHWRVLDRLIQDTNVGDSIPGFVQAVARRDAAAYFSESSSLTADPTQYGSAHAYMRVATVTSFLKKFPFGKVEGLDPQRTAQIRSAEAERRCRITNRRLMWFSRREYRLQRKFPFVARVLARARDDIHKLLGDEPDLGRILSQVRFGPGGAIGVSGDRTTAYYKFAAERYTCTPSVVPLACHLVLTSEMWRRYVVNPESLPGDPLPTPDEGREALLRRLEVISHNKVTFVPKDAKTHRGIAVEPFFNVYLQLGVGSVLRKKLRRWGINLNSQARNQHLAFLGSGVRLPVWDRPATLDLSMASDTLAIECVKHLLPRSWFNLLNLLRSPEGQWESGERTRWAKFSSMGNGFTFELESLIFSAVARAAMQECGFRDRQSFAVFGDDIIVPQGAAALLTEALRFIGFRVNTDKSFYFGDFRESCGSDWFKEVDVRPFFLKRKLQSAKDLVFLANSLHHRYSDGCRGHGVSAVSSWRFVTSRLPEDIAVNLRGPVTPDLEGHLHVPLDLAHASELVRWDRQLYAWSYATIIATARKFGGSPSARVLAALYGKWSGRVDSSLEASYQRVVGDRLALTQWVDTIGGGSSSREGAFAVLRRNATRYSLGTQVSTDWRNH